MVAGGHADPCLCGRSLVYAGAERVGEQVADRAGSIGSRFKCLSYLLAV